MPWRSKSTTFFPPRSGVGAAGSTRDSSAMAVIYRYPAARPVLSTAGWWNVTPDLFLGLVTHPRSRFAVATTETGLLRSLARAAEQRGLTVRVSVSDQDEYDPAALPITPDTIRESIAGELDSELRWREYVSGKPAGLTLRVFMAARRMKRTLAYLPPWRSRPGSNDAGPRMVRRLVNIELSHLRLIEEAAQSGARWALLFEDDAASTDINAFTTELSSFLEAAERRGQPLTMNLSESFSPEVLGITALLSPIPPSEAGTSWSVFSASRPVTNTVCAVLYRGDFLLRLHEALRGIPLAPVLPIDFKLNEALMRMAGEARPGDCWVASPAPLEQRSGVPAVRLRP